MQQSKHGENISIHIGQCGNQIGQLFWEKLLAEHIDSGNDYSTLPSSFFSTQLEKRRECSKARAILIDMEERVVSRYFKSAIAPFFNSKQSLVDTPGSGNCWMDAYAKLGPVHKEKILEIIRLTAEACDTLQSFIITHSCGGGTGSGLTSLLLEEIHDHYQDVAKLCSSILPDFNSDFVTISPYNTSLVISSLKELASLVFVFSNSMLKNAVNSQPESQVPFGNINNIFAQTLSDVTSSVRYPGFLNLDLVDIVTNMVPFRGTHFLGTSVWNLPQGRQPLYKDQRCAKFFHEIIQGRNLSYSCDIMDSTTLGVGLHFRGDYSAFSNLDALYNARKKMHFIPYLSNATKISHCCVGHGNLSSSVLFVVNSCGIWKLYDTIYRQASKLLRKQAFSHHYGGNQTDGNLQHSLNDLAELRDMYKELQYTYCANKNSMNGYQHIL